MLSSENESTYNVGTSVDVKPNEEEVILVIGTDRSFTFCIKQNKNVIQISDMMGEWDFKDKNVLEMESKYKNKVTEDRVNGLIKVWVCIHDKTFDEYNEELKILEVITQCLEGEKLNKHYSGKSIHVLQIKFTDYEHVPA
ncbi:6907_t:CDS:2 [Entrophospora sp. SA101]|nr:6907_t:CDS:2 [Entrophospora sp. SA101]